jgi:hypothetical protein
MKPPMHDLYQTFHPGLRLNDSALLPPEWELVLRHPPIAHSEPEPLAAVDPRTRRTEALAQDPLPRKNNFV